MHQSKLHEEWKKLCLIEKLEWLANSLDLNPLKNVWKLLKDAVQHGQPCPKTLKEFKVTLEREQTLVSRIKLCNSCHFVPTRLQSVIHAKRGHIYWQICNKSILINLWGTKLGIHVMNS